MTGPGAERLQALAVHRRQSAWKGSIEMGKGLILWLLGVPGVVVILLLVTHVI